MKWRLFCHKTWVSAGSSLVYVGNCHFWTIIFPAGKANCLLSCQFAACHITEHTSSSHHHVIMSHHHNVSLQLVISQNIPRHLITTLPCHLITSVQHVISQNTPCHIITTLPWDHVTSSPCHLITMLPRHHVSLQACNIIGHTWSSHHHCTISPLVT